ncbi:MAG: hypothetical protein JWM44_2856 [Bacilli bacterium]|nr:hypothetical protein [Bacilli bacterium]
MSKKLEKNGMWESSRMMLPEHREEILKENKKVHKRIRPHMHEEELEIISSEIYRSYRLNEEIELVLFDDYEDIHYTGIVIRMDQFNRVIKIQSGEDYAFIKMDDIVKVIVTR